MGEAALRCPRRGGAPPPEEGTPRRGRHRLAGPLPFRPSPRRGGQPLPGRGWGRASPPAAAAAGSAVSPLPGERSGLPAACASPGAVGPSRWRSWPGRAAGAAGGGFPSGIRSRLARTKAAAGGPGGAVRAAGPGPARPRLSRARRVRCAGLAGSPRPVSGKSGVCERSCCFVSGTKPPRLTGGAESGALTAAGPGRERDRVSPVSPVPRALPCRRRV